MTCRKHKTGGKNEEESIIVIDGIVYGVFPGRMREEGDSGSAGGGAGDKYRDSGRVRERTRRRSGREG